MSENSNFSASICTFPKWKSGFPKVEFLLKIFIPFFTYNYPVYMMYLKEREISIVISMNTNKKLDCNHVHIRATIVDCAYIVHFLGSQSVSWWMFLELVLHVYWFLSRICVFYVYGQILLLGPPLELSRSGLLDHFSTVPKVVPWKTAFGQSLSQRYSTWKMKKEIV